MVSRPNKTNLRLTMTKKTTQNTHMRTHMPAHHTTWPPSACCPPPPPFGLRVYGSKPQTIWLKGIYGCRSGFPRRLDDSLLL